MVFLWPRGGGRLGPVATTTASRRRYGLPGAPFIYELEKLLTGSAECSLSGQNLVKIGAMLVRPETPTIEALVDDLKLLRAKGLLQIAELELPALLQAARIVTANEETEDREAATEEEKLRAKHEQS